MDTLDRPISEVLKNDQNGFQATKQPPPTGTGIEHKDSRILKTFEGDVAESVRKHDESLTRMAIAEEERRKRQQKQAQPVQPIKKFGLAIISIVFVLVGVGAIALVQYIVNRKQQPIPVATTVSVIPTNSQTTIDITNQSYQQVLTSIKNALQAPQASSTLRQLLFTYQTEDANKKVITNKLETAQFTQNLLPNMPSTLSRAFDGVYILGNDTDASSTPFLLLTTSAYDQAFAGLLAWEPKMPTDIGNLFGLSANNATSTQFIDGIFQNRDIRILNDAQGNPFMIYGFLDNKTVLITTNLDTMKSIYTRFVAGQFVQ